MESVVFEEVEAAKKYGGIQALLLIANHPVVLYNLRISLILLSLKELISLIIQ